MGDAHLLVQKESMIKTFFGGEGGAAAGYQSCKVWILMTPPLLALGKWCRVERYDVPEEYFQAMLADTPNVFINSIREKRHLRPLYGGKPPKYCRTGIITLATWLTPYRNGSA